MRIKILILCSLLVGACTSPNALLQQVNQRFKPDGQVEKVAKGIYWYQWLGYDQVLERNSSLNVLAIDLKRAPVTFDFAWFNEPDQRATLSTIADTSLAIVAVNSGYFEKLNDGGYVTFHKSDGRVDQSVELPKDHTRFWKHQAAFVQDDTGEFAIIQGNQRLYDSLNYPNIVSSAPLLLSNGVPVGKYFVTQKTGDKSHLVSEHPDRHQAGLGPRMAYGLTEDNWLLLVAVDGRSKRARGINAEELTILFQESLNATDAVNMDGGGSITMFVRGATPNGVVNYPSDNRKTDPNRFDHNGQRRVGMALLVIPTSAKLRKKMQQLTVAEDPDAKDYFDASNRKK